MPAFNYFPPITPSNQTGFVAPSAPSLQTPQGPKKFFDDSDRTTKAREKVAEAMNDETFLCATEDFLKDYFPVKVTDDEVLACMQYLKDKEELSYSQKKRMHYWNKFETLPSKQAGGEDRIYSQIQFIVKAIYAFAGSINKRGNTYEFLSVPTNHLTASISGTNHRMDACIVETTNYSGVLTCDNVIVAKEYKDKRTQENQDQVRRQIVGDCHHILCDDARRMFIYGVTMEDHRMSLWYFSRSHSVKSVSFTWTGVDEITKENGIKTFIRIYLAFAFANPTQLGLDPTVHKAPLDPKSEDPSLNQQQFIYHYPPTRENGLTSSKYFKTLRSLTPSRPLRISGRATRVWVVIEVDSIDLANEVPGAEPAVLKDVWLDKDRRTEAENMDLIFAAVDKLVSDAQKRYPGPDGMRQFMAQDKRFEHFKQPTRDRLQKLLTNQRYKSLFLTKLYAWPGQETYPLSKNVKTPLTEIFYTSMRPSNSIHSLPNETRMASPQTGGQIGESHEESMARGRIERAMALRSFDQKRQSRFVYKEVCSSMWDLPSLGDAIDILRQCLDAAQILYCAGWVHRDISLNNILAIQAPGGSEIHWKVKLADLEFAQPHNHPNHSHDPRTGTPYFMPMEILSNSFHVYEKVKQANDKYGYSFAEQLKLPPSHPAYERFDQFTSFAPKLYTSIPANATPNIPARFSPVSYNYQHDLESLWWVTMYIITCGLGHLDSITYGAKIFKNTTTTVPKARSDAITLGVLETLKSLKPALLSKFPTFMDDLRGELHHHYIIREIFGQMAVDESYSMIHSLFAEKFDEILGTDDGGWKQVEVIDIAEAHKHLFDDEPLPAPEENAGGDSASATTRAGGPPLVAVATTATRNVRQRRN